MYDWLAALSASFAEEYTQPQAGGAAPAYDYDVGYEYYPGLPAPPEPPVKAGKPETLEEALAVIERVTTERDEIRKRSQELLNRVQASAASVQRSERYLTALRDILALFTAAERDGWVRSVYVPRDDLNGWLTLAETGTIKNMSY